MNAQAINQAMAELEGWKLSKAMGYKWTSPQFVREWSLPHDYTTDLNAVARVVGNLSPNQWREYRGELQDICRIEQPERDPIDALATQRCEAILRACGKWVEE